MSKETQIEVVDQDGLPRCEKCSYLMVKNEDTDKAGNLLKENNIPNRVFTDAGEAFAEKLAESELRSLFSDDLESNIEDKEELELQTEMLVVATRAEVGSDLYKHYLSKRIFIDTGTIADVVTDIYYEDIVGREECKQKSVIDLIKKRACIMTEEMKKTDSETDDVVGEQIQQMVESSHQYEKERLKKDICEIIDNATEIGEF